MLLAQQPANMRKEEAARGIVGIGIGFRVLVVHTMIAGPVVGGILEGNCIEDHQQHAQRPLSLVGAMGPQTMSASRNAQARDNIKSESYKNKIIYINI